MTLISTFFKETSEGMSRAEVHLGSEGYWIDFYDWSGQKITKEYFSGKSLYFVEDAAENWTLGYKNLNE